MAFLSYENKQGSGKKLKVHFDLPDDDDDYPNLKHSNSSSSDSSLDSDDTDKNDENHIDNVDSKYGLYGSPVGSFQGGLVTQSPPIQLMSSPSYDPNRIPSSVFGNKPTSPMDWSVASNESLFSIHIGNNSFSRDNAFAFNKSGELPRTSDFAGMPTTLPTVQEASAKEQNVNMERHSVSSNSSSESEDSDKGREHAASVVEVVDLTKPETTAAEGINEIELDKTPEDHDKEAKVLNGESKDHTSVSYLKGESDLGALSFQFPM